MTPEDAQHLATLLRDTRESLGLSAHEVARRAGVNVGTVTRIELGQIGSPRADSLTAIAEVLGLPVADVFAAAHWLPEGELPSMPVYLRATYRDLPEAAHDELLRTLEHLRRKYGHHQRGPRDGEDEEDEPQPSEQIN